MDHRRTLLSQLGISRAIIQAPMAGANDAEMVIAVSRAGALGSLPCAMLSPDQIEAAAQEIRKRTDAPFNLNFFCHAPSRRTTEEQAQLQTNWRAQLADYYVEFDLDPHTQTNAPNRAPFDELLCEVVERVKPPVVSFHFGLPEPALLERVKAAGCVILSSATTVAEAVWLEAHGCDIVIAQGYEAGGHRAMFLSQNHLDPEAGDTFIEEQALPFDAQTQPGLFALLPQIVDAINVPVIAAGGIADARGIVAATVLGASGVQLGTAYLSTKEAKISKAHKEALTHARDHTTALTNLFSGRPARGILNRVMREQGPMHSQIPPFPTAGGALAPLKAKSEQDFASLWAGQSSALSFRHQPSDQEQPTAATLTQSLDEASQTLIQTISNT